MKGMVLQAWANIVVCTSIDMTDNEDIHFEGGSAISRAGVVVFETTTCVQSSHTSFGHPSINFMLVLPGSNRGAGIVLGTYSTVCVATTVPP